MNSLLYTLAKTSLGGAILHWLFAYLNFAIPGEKLIENETLVAFHHPAPSYPLHILIVPKARFRSLDDLPSSDLAFESHLFSAVKELVRTFSLRECGYRLIVNGGPFQDIDHLHFHLISNDYQPETQ